MATAKQVTLQAKNTIISGTGSHKPGEVFKCSVEEATFLLKKDAAIKIGKGEKKIIPDSEEKKAAINLSKKEKTKAEKIQKKKAEKFEKERVKAEEESSKFVR